MNEMNVRVQCQAGPVCLHDQPCGQHSVTGRGDRRPVAQAMGQRLVAQAMIAFLRTGRDVTEVGERKTILSKIVSYVAKLSCVAFCL